MKILFFLLLSFSWLQQPQNSFSNLYFRHNESELTLFQKQALNKIAAQLISSGKKCTIEGHAAHSEGTNESTKRLSKLRAETALNYLKQRRVPESQLRILSFGSSRPIASNETPDGRAQNRRVEFTLQEL